jgi:hypothetical protein
VDTRLLNLPTCHLGISPSFRLPTKRLPLSLFSTLSQKPLFLSPLLATLTHSCSCNPFVCHSYENTGMASHPRRKISGSLPTLCLRYSVAIPPLLRSAFPVSGFRMNISKCITKQTTLTSFRINTYEKRGEGVGGGYPLLARQRPRRVRPSDQERHKAQRKHGMA